MVRLRIALGVASSLVAVAALSIVFAGSGEAQGPNVFVTNTPLPVTGNVTATLAGNVSANIINPADSPVLIRDVDGQRAKELWQTSKSVNVSDGNPFGLIEFDPVPRGKALVVEHINLFFQDSGQLTTRPTFFAISNTASFTGILRGTQYFVPQQFGIGFMADVATKFYVAPGEALEASVARPDSIGGALWQATATGYFVNYP